MSSPSTSSTSSIPTTSNPLSKLESNLSFPILRSVEEVRNWRNSLNKQGVTVKEVGFVPTMGALHEGHLSLVKASLLANDATIVSIFVNPAQFAPHEDLNTYPRTLESDLKILQSLSVTLPSPTSPTSTTSTTSSDATSQTRSLSALFLPPVEALYPSGITTNVSEQRGTFVEVKGLQEVMEGNSRPGFFRGVATVVLKLFNIVQPTRAYLGQKDIQQALLLRRMLTDLHLSTPFPNNLIIHPTFRNESTGLALSSRNAYLNEDEREYSNVLIDALRKGETYWKECESGGKESTPLIDVQELLTIVYNHVKDVKSRASSKSKDAEIEMLYISLNDPVELTELKGLIDPKQCKGAVLSGAVMMGKTRLIDNLVFGFELNPGGKE